MVEAVWGEHKTAEQIITILERFSAADELGLVTRVSPEKADAVLAALPAVKAHAHARCLTLGELPAPPPGPPPVAVLSGGSSDRSVVAEATLALRWIYPRKFQRRSSYLTCNNFQSPAEVCRAFPFAE